MTQQDAENQVLLNELEAFMLMEKDRHTELMDLIGTMIDNLQKGQK